MADEAQEAPELEVLNDFEERGGAPFGEDSQRGGVDRG